jgi:energy-coupling factor transporter ATP-binding protein EcfA2
MNNYTWKTGFPALDKMLGFERPAWQRASIVVNTNETSPKGQIVLLRGAPGTGKTTLGLQMLLNHLVSNASNCPGLFISLEADPKRVLDSMKAGNRLPKHLLAKSDGLITLGRDQCSKQISSADATAFGGYGERLIDERNLRA